MSAEWFVLAGTVVTVMGGGYWAWRKADVEHVGDHRDHLIDQLQEEVVRERLDHGRCIERVNELFETVVHLQRRLEGP